MSTSDVAPNKQPKAKIIGFLLLALLISGLAATANAYIGNIWVQNGLAADAGSTITEPMQPDEMIYFALSGIIAVCPPGFTAAWITNLVLARRSNASLPVTLRSTLWSIRTGATAPLTAAVLVIVFSFALLIVGPGLFELFTTNKVDWAHK